MIIFISIKLIHNEIIRIENSQTEWKSIQTRSWTKDFSRGLHFPWNILSLRFIPYNIYFGKSGTRLANMLNFLSKDRSNSLLQVVYTLDSINVH